MLAWQRMLRCGRCMLPWPAAARCGLMFMLGRRTQRCASCAPAATLWHTSQEVHRGSAEKIAAVIGLEGSGEPSGVCERGERHGGASTQKCEPTLRNVYQ